MEQNLLEWAFHIPRGTGPTHVVEQALPMCWNWIWEYKIKCATTQELGTKVLCLKENGTPISNKFPIHIAKGKIQDTLCCV